MKNKYAIKDLKKEYGTEEKCLRQLFDSKYFALKHCKTCYKETKSYYIKSKKRFDTTCGHSLYSTKDTIFYKSSTPLTSWFHAMFLFSVSKNEVSAKELERQLGVTYKTAWRVANKNR